MARRRAAFTSISTRRSVGSKGCRSSVSVSSGSLHEGQRLAKPGLPGRSSNSSWQTTQVRIGKGIDKYVSEKWLWKSREEWVRRSWAEAKKAVTYGLSCG